MQKNKGIVFAGLGFELVGVVLACLYFGQLIDKIYGWGGFGVALMIVLGTAGWFFHLIILLKRFMKNDCNTKE
jgi:F0F1-type ATP synthase assembly protein I